MARDLGEGKARPGTPPAVSSRAAASVCFAFASAAPRRAQVDLDWWQLPGRKSLAASYRRETGHMSTTCFVVLRMIVGGI